MERCKECGAKLVPAAVRSERGKVAAMARWGKRQGVVTDVEMPRGRDNSPKREGAAVVGVNAIGHHVGHQCPRCMALETGGKG